MNSELSSQFDAAWAESSVDLMATFGSDVTLTLPSPCGEGPCGVGLCGVTTLTLKAMIDWPDDDKPIEGMPRITSPWLNVTVLNDPDEGLSADDFTADLRFTLPVRCGSSTTRSFRFTRIVRQDSGLLTCEVR